MFIKTAWMLAYQRVQSIANDFQTSQMLLQAGLDSALAISSMSEERFMIISGLSHESSRLVYERARDRALGSTHYFESVRDALLGNFNDLAVGNQASLVNDLRGIDGFEQLIQAALIQYQTRKRDVLCDYIIARSETFNFSDRSDLYSYFLSFSDNFCGPEKNRAIND